MNKAVKKLLAVLLVSVLVFAMAVPAFAVSNSKQGTIEFENTLKDETYTIYRIFTLDSYDRDANAYSYTVENEWETFFRPGAEGAKYISVNKQGHPTWIGADTETAKTEFAQKAMAWAKNHVSNQGKETSTEDGSTITFSGLDLGYYLVSSSLGALCSLTTTEPNATVHEKNAVPTIDKTVETKPGSNDWKATNTAKIGDTVSYKVEITVEAGTQKYVLSDTMTDGLTFSSTSLKVSSVKGDAVANIDYSFKSKNNGFELSLDDAYVSRVGAGNVITVTYTATLNENAVIDGNGNQNSATLNYGNKQSVTKETTTYSYEFDLVKIDDVTSKLLDGAEFELYESETSDEPIKFVLTDKGYRVANGKEQGAASTIAVNKSAHIYGLDKTVYYLKETKAPDGYNQLTDRQMVDLSKGSNNTTLATGATTWNDNGGVVVRNNAGATLPSTGGMGTTLFYVIGGGLMVAAAVLLITKKRMERKN